MSIVRRAVVSYRAAFSGLSREVWLLCAAALVNRAGTMVLPFLSLYLTDQLDMTPTRAGQLLALFGIGSVIGSYVGGWLSDRLGAVRVLILTLAGSGVAFFALGQARSTTAVAVMVLVTSIVADAFRPALMVAISHYSTPETRIRAFALLRLAANAGMAIGPAVGGFLAVRHYAWLFAGDALTCWAAGVVLLIWFGIPESPVHREDTGEKGDISASPWRDPPFLVFLVLIFALACTFFQLWCTWPIHLRDVLHLSEASIGSLFALNAGLIVLFEMLLMRSVEHFDHLRVVGVGAVLVTTGLAALVLQGGAVIAVASILVITLGEMLSLPLANAFVANRAPATRTGAYMGAYTVAFACAFVVAPAVGSLVFERLGADVLWLGIGGLGLIVGTGFLALSATSRRDVGRG